MTIPIATLTLSPTVDLSSEADHVVPVHKIRTRSDTLDPGGGGINVARVVTELGGTALAIALAGGSTGKILEDLLERIGIDRKLIPVSALTRISHTVHETATDLEFRFVPAGSALTPEEIEACLAAISQIECDYFVASGSLPTGTPPDLLARIARIVADRGAKFVLDSSGAGLTSTLGRAPVHLVKPSLNELEAYCGRSLSEDQAQEAAARQIVTSGAAEIVALSLGADGALLVTKDETIRRRPPKLETKSTVGAGDSFVAAMTLALWKGHPPADAFCAGMAAGAAAVLTPGTTLCRREDVERFFALLCPAEPEVRAMGRAV